MHNSVLKAAYIEDVHEFELGKGIFCIYVVYIEYSDWFVDLTVFPELQGKFFYRRYEDVITDLLLDSSLKDFMDFTAKPIFRKGSRFFGPFRSGMVWERLEIIHKDKTVICAIAYSDSTEFYKGVSAWPIFCKILYTVYMLYIFLNCFVFSELFCFLNSYSRKHRGNKKVFCSSMAFRRPASIKSERNGSCCQTEGLALLCRTHFWELQQAAWRRDSCEMLRRKSSTLRVRVVPMAGRPARDWLSLWLCWGKNLVYAEYM